MKTYRIYDFDNELRSTVQANSFNEAFIKGVGNYVYREASKDDYYDIKIECNDTVKYIFIRVG